MKLRIFLLFLLVLTAGMIASGQKAPKKLTITGIVSDSEQMPVTGAMILIDNKKTDCITNEKGIFKIKVRPEASVITVFTMQKGMIEQPIGGRTVINFTYASKNEPGKTDQKGIKNEETVNVGYGSMKKSDITNTVGKIDGQNKKYASYTNIYDMIKGEVPGVQVSGKSITIQGPSSINLSSEPLFVIDGMVVTSIDDIRPQQVKSIEILKGPAASIYGSRGTNGVIIINLIGAEKKK